MNPFNDMLALASEYQAALPPRIREYLRGRGITDEVVDLHRLGWTGSRIAIPMCDREGTPIFFKLAKDPEDTADSPKMLASSGSSVSLYGWERVAAKPCRIVICEGEFDRLVLESRGIAAVTSTGGAGVFRQDWADAFREIPEVFVCFDHDEPGHVGALKVARMIPHAKIVNLPDEVGDGGDVTDFFVRLGRTVDAFSALLDAAEAAPPIARPRTSRPASSAAESPFAQRAADLKAAVPIIDVVVNYVDLRPSRDTFRGQCPFHAEDTPSFVVYPKTASFHCFGCGKHGDVITFLMDYFHLSFFQAIDLLEETSHHYGPRPEEAA